MYNKIERLLTELRNGDSALREDALKRLGPIIRNPAQEGCYVLLEIAVRLKDDDHAIRLRASELLGNAAWDRDMSSAVPQLAEALFADIEVLGRMEGDPCGVATMLDDGWEYEFRNHLENALMGTANRSFVHAERVQKEIEQACVKWIQKRPTPHNASKMHKNRDKEKNAIAIIQRIAQIKAKGASERDGELLAGETVPKPAKDGRRMYQAVLRNG